MPCKSITSSTPEERPSNKWPLSNGPKVVVVTYASLIFSNFMLSEH